MNPGTIRRNNVIEIVVRAAFAGVRWKEVFRPWMAELNITTQQVEARIRAMRKVGVQALSKGELVLLDKYMRQWLKVVRAKAPSTARLRTLKNVIRPLIDELYRDVFEISTPPEIVFCQSPAKFALYMKLLSDKNGSRVISSSEQFQRLAREVVSEFSEKEQRKFVLPAQNEFANLCAIQGEKLFGRSLSYRLHEYMLQDLCGNLKNETGEILGTCADEFYGDGISLRFEPISRLLGSIFEVDLHFSAMGADGLANAGPPPLMAHTNAFNRETWGLWESGYLFLGAGFVMEHLHSRGTFSERCQKELQLCLNLFNIAPWYSMFERLCIVGMYPIQRRLDEQFRLSCRDGAAALFSDGWRMWAIEGARVPRRLIDAPDSLTVGDIRNAENANVRRIMIDLYGASRFLKDSGSRMIHKDDFGELYQQELPGDEPLTMVLVTNSTMEADGSFRRYFLRVPPHVRTAQEAVAWTFGLDPREYNPEIES